MLSDPLITWLLVRIRPSWLMTIPVPTAEARRGEAMGAPPSTTPGSTLAATAEARSEPPPATLFCGPGTWCDDTPVGGVPALLVRPTAAALPSPAAASTTTADTAI